VTARADPDAQIFMCPLCGPCLALRYDDDGTTVLVTFHHEDVEHPDWFTFDEDNPQ